MEWIWVWDQILFRVWRCWNCFQNRMRFWKICRSIESTAYFLNTERNIRLRKARMLVSFISLTFTEAGSRSCSIKLFPAASHLLSYSHKESLQAPPGDPVIHFACPLQTLCFRCSSLPFCNLSCPISPKAHELRFLLFWQPWSPDLKTRTSSMSLLGPLSATK